MFEKHTLPLTCEWFAAMRRADFSAAWQISDRILASRAPGQPPWDLPRHELWVWDGRPLENARVLVRCYHGLGDTIHFARFLPRLTGETTVWVQPALIDLLSTLPGRRRLLPLHDGTPDVEYDVDIEIMELAHAFRVREDELARNVPYFEVPRGPRVSDRFAVGVVADTGGWDATRALPRDLVSDLARVDNVELFNFQVHEPVSGMRDLSTPDILELARRLRRLDLVLTPDSMVAHLAGALAVPTWTLLPVEADWRWLQPERSDSPWYPTMRLFRQPRAGDWRSVFREVNSALSSCAR